MKAMQSIGLLVAAGTLAAAGCSSKLETGYEPRQLGASPAERRGYYASPFTPEANVAAQSQTDDMRTMRRPGNFR